LKVSVVGMTGFEPATTRPPDVYATGLRHIPICFANLRVNLKFAKQIIYSSKPKTLH
jgi:hypothetical protein